MVTFLLQVDAYNLEMILEIAFVEVASEDHSGFETAVKRAVAEVLSTAWGFIDFELHRGIEQSNTYAFHIHWETLEDHTIGFRESDLFLQWRGIIDKFKNVFNPLFVTTVHRAKASSRISVSRGLSPRLETTSTEVFSSSVSSSCNRN